MVSPPRIIAIRTALLNVTAISVERTLLTELIESSTVMVTFVSWPAVKLFYLLRASLSTLLLDSNTKLEFDTVNTAELVQVTMLISNNKSKVSLNDATIEVGLADTSRHVSYVLVKAKISVYCFVSNVT